MKKILLLAILLHVVLIACSCQLKEREDTYVTNTNDSNNTLSNTEEETDEKVNTSNNKSSNQSEEKSNEENEEDITNHTNDIINHTQQEDHLIIINGYVIGKYENQGFLPFENFMNKEIEPYKDYKIYQHDKVLSNLQPLSFEYRSDYDKAQVNRSYLVEDIDIHQDFVILPSFINARPRPISKISYPDDYHKNVIRKMLDKKGLTNTPVIIRSIKEVDLNDDGELEQIIYASNYGKLDENTHNYYSSSDTNYESPVSELKDLHGIGMYKIYLVIVDNRPQILHEVYHDLDENDLFPKTEEDIIALLDDDNIEVIYEDNPSDELQENYPVHDLAGWYFGVYLFQKNNEVAIFRIRRKIHDNLGNSKVCYMEDPLRLIDIIDLNDDNQYEIVFFKSDRYNWDWIDQIVSIYRIENKELFKIISYKFLQ